MNQILKPGFAMKERLPQFDEFKAQYPDQIATKFEEERFNPNKEDWFLITCIHNAINNCCRYKKDVRDHWHIMTDLVSVGDCEDFVFTKRLLYDRAGYSLNAFVPVICEPFSDKQFHMVLCIRTIHGDFIADNLIRDIRELNRFPYKWNYMLINDTWRGVL